MRDFAGVRRVVIKVGTNILAPEGLPDDRRLEDIAGQIAALVKAGQAPLLVTSGAIGFGMRELGLKKRPKKVEQRQACAAVGQPILMTRWKEAMATHGITAAQILLTRETFDDRRSYLNLRNAVESLLDLGAVPILNENDSVSTSEIGDVFGDNDSLSAHVASKLDADLLVLLTDIDAFYDKDPRKFSDAKALAEVEKITEAIRGAAGDAGSSGGTGGMRTKLAAVDIASRAGCRTVLADGREADILSRVLAGEVLGTHFASGRRLGARARWILSARPKGKVAVDDGALAALNKRKSLLPSGVTQVEGIFAAGDVITLGDRFKAVASMDSEEIRKVAGRHSRDARALLGQHRKEEVARAEDIVPMKE